MIRAASESPKETTSIKEMQDFKNLSFQEIDIIYSESFLKDYIALKQRVEELESNIRTLSEKVELD